MSDKELIKASVEEFSRLQSYMLLCDENSDVYKMMKTRYIELKVILTSLSVNLAELDIISK